MATNIIVNVIYIGMKEGTTIRFEVGVTEHAVRLPEKIDVVIDNIDMNEITTMIMIMSDYDEDDDYYTGMSSVEEDVALPLLTVDDIFIHQHFTWHKTRDGPPVPVCYKMNTKGNIGKINSVICPDDINDLSECVNNFNQGWEMMNSTQRWPGQSKRRLVYSFGT